MRIVPVADIPKKKEPITTNLVELYKVCCDMEILCTNEDGIGLHAFQVGLPWNVFVMRREDGRYESYIECEYIPVGETKVVSIEGCLSLRNEDLKFKQYKLERYEKVRIVGKQLKDMQLVDIDNELTGLYAIVAQHEIDHSKNRLISDIGMEIYLEQLRS